MSGDLPLVSIIIPAYNYAGYLEEAIESVLNQDYPNIELLVLNDGSTDNTHEVLEGYGDRFYWETQENMGETNTLNKGWAMSKGDVLAKLSADDVLYPGAVSTCVALLLANPDAVMAYCDFDMISEDSSVIRRADVPESSYQEIVAKLANPVGPGAFFWHSAFEAAGPWDNSLRLCNDFDFWIRLGLHGRFLRTSEVLASFRVHGDSQSLSKTDELKSDEFIRVVSDYYELRRVPPDVLAVKRESLSNAHVLSARSHVRSKRYGKGLARFFKALWLHPRNLSVATTRILVRGLLAYIKYGRYLKGRKPRQST